MTREVEAETEATGTDSRPEGPVARCLVTAQAEAAAHQDPVSSTQDGLEAIPEIETQQGEGEDTRGNRCNGKEEEAEWAPTVTVTGEEVRGTGGDTGTTPRKPGTTCTETGATTKRLEGQESIF